MQKEVLMQTPQTPFIRLEQFTGTQQQVRLSGPAAAHPMLLADLVRRSERLVVAIVERPADTEALRAAVQFYLHQSDSESSIDIPIIHLPDWETLPYDAFSPHEDIISERLAALSQLTHQDHGLLVIPASSFAQRFPPKSHVEGQRFALKVGQQLDLTTERRRLEHAGYHAVDTVREHGEFAIRGAILDVFPMGSAHPIRIDLFDAEIETLRAFDPDTQRTLTRIDEITLLPAREIPLTESVSNASDTIGMSDLRGIHAIAPCITTSRLALPRQELSTMPPYFLMPWRRSSTICHRVPSWCKSVQSTTRWSGFGMTSTRAMRAFDTTVDDPS